MERAQNFGKMKETLTRVKETLTRDKSTKLWQNERNVDTWQDHKALTIRSFKVCIGLANLMFLWDFQTRRLNNI